MAWGGRVPINGVQEVGGPFPADRKYLLRVSITLVFRDPPALVARILTKELKGNGRDTVET